MRSPLDGHLRRGSWGVSPSPHGVPGEDLSRHILVAPELLDTIRQNATCDFFLTHKPPRADPLQELAQRASNE